MARRFRFKLEALLRVRELHEQQAKRKLGAKLVEIARLDALDVSTRREIAVQHDALRAAQRTDALDPSELTRRRAWVAFLRRTLSERAAARTGMDAEARLLREQVRAARVQTRTLERLRERRASEHARREAVLEQRDADELARQLHLRGRSADATVAEQVERTEQAVRAE